MPAKEKTALERGMPRDAYTLSVSPLGHWKASLVHATSATGQYATFKRGTNANAAVPPILRPGQVSRASRDRAAQSGRRTTAWGFLHRKQSLRRTRTLSCKSTSKYAGSSLAAAASPRAQSNRKSLPSRGWSYMSWPRIRESLQHLLIMVPLFLCTL